MEVEIDWGKMNVQFGLAGARIIALPEEGGCIVEDDLDLVVSEGRHESFGYLAPGQSRHSLDYSMAFCVASVPVPEAGTSINSEIVIAGTTDDGVTLEIRGSGLFGYDDMGNPEGYFEEPPTIVIVGTPTVAERLKSQAVEVALSGIPLN